MTILPRSARLATALCFLLPAIALAQNIDISTATYLTIGQLPVKLTLTNTITDSQSRYYRIEPHIGRSYCIEMTTADDEYGQADPRITLRTNTNGQIDANDNLEGNEPDGYHQARLCHRFATDATHYIQAAQQSLGTFKYNMRVVETTLWAPWFFIAGDYNSFVLLRNTTNQAVDVVITWRNAAAFIVGTASGSVPGRGALTVNSRNVVTGAGDVSGTVEIAHNGSPEAIVGQVTTLSATTGLNFDTIFSQRKPWD